MTIDEVIKMFEHNAEYERTHGNLQGWLEFRQLAEWLVELKKLNERTGWISVSERLPKENEEVLVTFKSDDEIRVYNCKYFDNSPWWKNYVIAWMPLPEPYKVESEE